MRPRTKSLAAARVATALVLAGALTAPLTPAAAFGTIDGLGQHREHEMITRTLSCDATDKPALCFGPHTLDLLAGKKGSYGAVGEPDNILKGLGPGDKHCDDGDYAVDGERGYRQTEEEARRNLRKCIALYDKLLGQAADAAGRLVDSSGDLRQRQADITNGSPTKLRDDCEFDDTPKPDQPAKCEVLNGLGRALHLAEDFWAHSNWGDEAKSGERGIKNPKGLNRADVPAFFSFPAPAQITIPDGLITGCDDSVPLKGDFRCRGRIGHSDLAKDKGRIDWRTGATSDPGMRRGKVGDNFQKAVTGARAQARYTWEQLAANISTRYGDHATTILNAIVDDTPWTGCTRVGGDAKAALDPPRNRVPEGARTVDVRLDNRTDRRLGCGRADLQAGTWANFPETGVAAGSETHWKTAAAQADADTKGTVVYRVGDSSAAVKVRWDNQASEPDRYTCTAGEGYRCTVREEGGPRHRELRVALTSA